MTTSRSRPRVSGIFKIVVGEDIYIRFLTLTATAGATASLRVPEGMVVK